MEAVLGVSALTRKSKIAILFDGACSAEKKAHPL